MGITVKRPAPATAPDGLLGYELFQTCYVTNDLDRAIEVFRQMHKVANWTILDTGPMRIALAWSHGHQLELIHTGTDYQPLYDDWVDKAGAFTMRFHHFGYFVNDDAEWDLLNRQIEDDGRSIAFQTNTDALKVIYVPAPELGHFLEYIYPNAQGRAFFESVAAN